MTAEAPPTSPAQTAPAVVTAPPSGVTTVAPAAPAATSSTAQAATASRGYAAGRFALTLGGVAAGNLRSVEGGAATSDVVVERAGPDGIAAKHLGGVRFEEISVVTDLSATTLIDWVAASWKNGFQRKNGSIQTANFDNTIVAEREFTDALVTETTLPTLDAGSKDAGHITVKLAPESTRLTSPSGKMTASAGKATKSWSLSSFRFEMAGLDGSRVIKIDSFTVRQAPTNAAVGESRDSEKAPGTIQFPNLRISLATSSASTWQDWHEAFVVKGNNGADQERAGAIVYLDAATRAELGRVNLSGCGIYRLTPEAVTAGADAVQRMVAELYCERMELSVKGAGA